MSDLLSKPVTAFIAHRLLRAGPLVEVALAVKAAGENDPANSLLVFDDATGRVVDLDLRGTQADIIERLSQPPRPAGGRYRPRPSESAEPVKEEPTEPKGRGRPKLGVVAREVTLLPRQWEWLATQPGGASAVLRRLVDDARKSTGSRQQRRAAQEAAYQFMLGIAGDFPDYEDATRALFADDRTALEQRIAAWPEAIRDYVMRLAFGTEGMPS
ncbi:DUF2239 family protein [Pseudomonas gingeri]|uniref:DUF2239 family protein n=1 Tax=Pseudomonas gingeri TaxID=117681 RepID=UPI0015A0D6BC|nr:DUF2239 family protein [Pseudomonas gingeri]NWA12187.1 DUF2239 family protein [Pseudomonas gingeri]NWA57407.1 DUF2239 family protein [Pseudomonas gingeri]NWA93750.1 DUF2239 family protein [Pseudomonas gingeri]NWB03222.1 DUF2239 family protein [Pseudomonas gingeri]